MQTHLVCGLPVGCRGLWCACIALSVVLCACGSLGGLCGVSSWSLAVALRLWTCCLALLAAISTVAALLGPIALCRLALAPIALLVLLLRCRVGGLIALVAGATSGLFACLPLASIVIPLRMLRSARVARPPLTVLSSLRRSSVSLE